MWERGSSNHSRIAAGRHSNNALPGEEPKSDCIADIPIGVTNDNGGYGYCISYLWVIQADFVFDVGKVADTCP